MVSLLVAGALIWMMVLRRAQRFAPITLFVLADVALFSGVMLYRTRSNTSIGAAISFVVVWSFWTLIRYLHRNNRLAPDALHRAVYPAFVTGAAVLTWAGVQFQNTILGIFGETVDFNGRTALWQYSWTGFLERPIFGWGWLSAWRTPKFFTRD
jgi:O-antigen ligase